MNLIVEELPPISSAEERVDEVECPGRDGSYYISQGYKPINKNVIVHYEGNDPDKLLEWLRGSGKVVFGNLPDRYYQAIINNKIELTQIIAAKLYRFPVIFTCQPFSYLIDGDDPHVITSGCTLFHGRSTAISRPIITLTGSGSVTVNINGRSFQVTDLSEPMIIDSNYPMVLNKRGKYMKGNFPYLDVGENVITWNNSNVQVEIIPKWRCYV